jgi:hypothetical protein
MFFRSRRETRSDRPRACNSFLGELFLAISFSFDIKGAHTDDRARISLGFERLGWKSVGQSHWLYEKSATETNAFDFFNQIMPALWNFRMLVIDRSLEVTFHSLQFHGHSSFTGTDISTQILSAYDLPMIEPSISKSRSAKLSAPRYRQLLAGDKPYNISAA